MNALRLSTARLLAALTLALAGCGNDAVPDAGSAPDTGLAKRPDAEVLLPSDAAEPWDAATQPLPDTGALPGEDAATSSPEDAATAPGDGGALPPDAAEPTDAGPLPGEDAATPGAEAPAMPPDAAAMPPDAATAVDSGTAFREDAATALADAGAVSADAGGTPPDAGGVLADAGTADGGTCSWSTDCNVATQEVCDPSAGQCTASMCEEHFDCGQGNLCLFQGAAGGACYQFCQVGSTSCSSGQECRALAFRTELGVCVTPTIAVEGAPCVANDQCGPNLTCLDDVCSRSCNFWAAQSGCPSSSWCGYRNFCFTPTLADVSAPGLGAACPAPLAEGDGCGPADGRLTGSCVRAGTALVCRKRCRVHGKGDCAANEACDAAFTASGIYDLGVCVPATGGADGTACTNADDCASPDSFACSPSTLTCKQGGECVYDTECTAGQQCLYYSQQSVGACFGRCHPYTVPSGCQSDEECVSLNQADTTGYCQNAGTAGLYTQCEASATSTGCTAGLDCQTANNGNSYCFQKCNFWSATSGCGQGNWCYLWNSTCGSALTGLVALGTACGAGADEGTACAASGSRYIGACTKEGTTFMCRKLCRAGIAGDCDTGQTCTTVWAADYEIEDIGVCQVPNPCSTAGCPSATASKCNPTTDRCEACVVDADCAGVPAGGARLSCLQGTCTPTACDPAVKAPGPANGPDSCRYGESCQGAACSATLPDGSCASASVYTWNKTLAGPVITGFLGVSFPSDATLCAGGNGGFYVDLDFYAPAGMLAATSWTDRVKQVKFIKPGGVITNSGIMQNYPSAPGTFGTLRAGLCGGSPGSVPLAGYSVYLLDSAGAGGNAVCLQ